MPRKLSTILRGDRFTRGQLLLAGFDEVQQQVFLTYATSLFEEINDTLMTNQSYMRHDAKELWGSNDPAFLYEEKVIHRLPFFRGKIDAVKKTGHIYTQGSEGSWEYRIIPQSTEPRFGLIAVDNFDTKREWFTSTFSLDEYFPVSEAIERELAKTRLFSITKTKAYR